MDLNSLLENIKKSKEIFFLFFIKVKNNIIILIERLEIVWSKFRIKYKEDRKVKFMVIVFTILVILVTYIIIPNRTKRVLFSGEPDILMNVEVILDKNPLMIHFLDCNQGDAIFLEYEGFNILIDSGPIESINYVHDYLTGMTKSIDYYIITHGHDDHLSGYSKIMEDFKIKQLFLPSQSDDEFIPQVIKEAKNKKIKINNLKTGNVIKIKDLTINVLAPSIDNYDNLNNSSIVLEVSLKDVNVLLCGDHELTGDQIPNKEYDVIKAGHHGSKTSTDELFLKIHKPKLFIISCGLKNRFNHPFP